jgi:hypothetical protein
MKRVPTGDSQHDLGGSAAVASITSFCPALDFDPSKVGASYGSNRSEGLKTWGSENFSTGSVK